MAGPTEQAALEKINNEITRINEKVTELSNKINSVLSNVPSFLGWVVDRVEALWDEFVAAMERLWEKITEIFSNLGSPSTLWDTADDWSELVGGPVSGIAGNAHSDNSEIDRYWEGDAAVAYLDTLMPQRVAMEKIQTTFSEPVATALSGMAKAIIAFWVSLGIALASLVAGLIGAAAASGTIIGIPAGIVVAIGAVAVCVAAIAAGYLILKSEASSAKNTLTTKLNDNTGFRDEGAGPAWPASVIMGN